MVIDLSFAPWMILPGLLLFIAVILGIMWLIDELDIKYNKIDTEK
jgi:hypothetical protein